MGRQPVRFFTFDVRPSFEQPRGVPFVVIPKLSFPRIPVHQHQVGPFHFQTLRRLLAPLASQQRIYGYASFAVTSVVDDTVKLMLMRTIKLPHISTLLSSKHREFGIMRGMAMSTDSFKTKQMVNSSNCRVQHRLCPVESERKGVGWDRVKRTT